MRKRFLSIMLSLTLVFILLPITGRAAGLTAWDGKTIDVSWYNKTSTTFDISTPAQLMGLAAIVNGIYNRDITSVIGDKSVIVDSAADNKDINVNNKSTGTYHFGADSFKDKTVRLTANLDMGGVYNAGTDTWTGPNYMPIGGQYLITQNDSTTKLSSSFCGTFDGQGHTVYNIYCSRRCTNGNFGDGQSVGLIGRLGVHDNDPADIRPTNPTVKNIAVTGYIYANRSVGGIVGKLGKTTYNAGDGSIGGIIENCANFATVSNTDAKGCGGICGSAWNGGLIQNCYNAGRVMSTYTCPTSGIAGSNEITLTNCYSIGTISAMKEPYAMGIGTNNGGAPYKTAVANCWYLDGSAPGGGYFSNGGTNNDGALTAAKMKTADFAVLLGNAFTQDVSNINSGYPILAWQKGIKAPMFSTFSDVPVTSWYSGAVSYVMSKGLFDTVGDKAFGPDRPMTRAMLVTALYRLKGEPTMASNRIFADVPESAAFFKAVAWAYENKIVTGVSADSFAPADSITREQLAAMLKRYAVFVGTNIAAANDTSTFADTCHISTWALDAMKWAIGTKLLNGSGDGKLNPSGTASRAEVAQILFNFNGIVNPQ